MSTDRYTSPFCERYASKEMQYIFSPDKKFKTWRKLWIALAETEYELGLSENSCEHKRTEAVGGDARIIGDESDYTLLHLLKIGHSLRHA